MMCQYHFNHNLNSFQCMFCCNSNFQLQSVLLSCRYNCSNMDVCIYSVCIYCIYILPTRAHPPDPRCITPDLVPLFIRPSYAPKESGHHYPVPQYLGTQYSIPLILLSARCLRIQYSIPQYPVLRTIMPQFPSLLCTSISQSSRSSCPIPTFTIRSPSYLLIQRNQKEEETDVGDTILPQNEVIYNSKFISGKKTFFFVTKTTTSYVQQRDSIVYKQKQPEVVRSKYQPLYGYI